MRQSEVLNVTTWMVCIVNTFLIDTIAHRYLAEGEVSGAILAPPRPQ